MDTVLSILVLAAIALVWGAFALWRRGGSRKQVVLMLIAAAVLAANVVIWVIPLDGRPAPPSSELR
ncbi:MAG TPA: hypothetical protein PK479_06610 [Novosphingobium sp.]|nr:hypothetical protein [Novosphingobium sp.]HNN56788.1 hypothetical protein [Novosphingobium sp.]